MCKKSVKLKTQSSRNTCNNRLYIYIYYEPHFDCYLVGISLTSIKLHHIFLESPGTAEVLPDLTAAAIPCFIHGTELRQSAGNLRHRGTSKKISWPTVADGRLVGWNVVVFMWVKRHGIRISKEFRESRHHPGTKLLTLFHCKCSYFLAKGCK